MAQPAAEFSADAFTVPEGAGPARVKVNRTGALDVAIRFTLTASGGSAVPGRDYDPTPITARLEPNERSKELLLPIFDDSFVDGDRTVNLLLISPDTGQPFEGLSQASLTIQDNETPGLRLALGFNPDALSLRRLDSPRLFPFGPDILLYGGASQPSGTTSWIIEQLRPDGSLAAVLLASSVLVELLSVAPDGSMFVSTDHQLEKLKPNGSLDPNFHAEILSTNGSFFPRIALVQPEGKVLVAGELTDMSGEGRSHLVRLNSDGALDPGFAASVGDSFVVDLALEPSGSLLVALSTALIGTNGFPSQLEERIVRLSPSGALEKTFAWSADFPLGVPDEFSTIKNLRLQPDGKLLVSANSRGKYYSSDSLFRLNSDGSVDGGFTAALGGGQFFAIRDFALQPDGGILLSCSCSQGGSCHGDQLVRLLPNGQLDPRFDPGLGPDGPITSICLTEQNTAVVAGDFQTYDGIARPGVARVDLGMASRGAAFVPDRILVSESAGTAFVTVQRRGESSGSLEIAYTTRDGTAIAGVHYLARAGTIVFGPLENTKTIPIPVLDNPWLDGDVSFDVELIGAPPGVLLGPPSNRMTVVVMDDDRPGTAMSGFKLPLLPDRTGWLSVQALAFQPDGRILIGGRFSADGQQTGIVARLLPDGSLDPSFVVSQAAEFSAVLAMVLQPDGRIVIGGDFPSIQEVARKNLARLNSDGSLDLSFDPGQVAGSSVTCLAQHGDALLAGGQLFNVTAGPRYGLVRLLSDGKPDPNFDSPLPSDASLDVIAILPNGRIYVGGSFATGPRDPGPRNLARLQPDGKLDSTFDPAEAEIGWTKSLSVQADGDLVVCCSTTVGLLARLTDSGRVDPAFKTALTPLEGSQEAIVVADGKVLLSGIVALSDGSTRHGLTRLNTDGSIDAAFASTSLPMVGGSLQLQGDNVVWVFRFDGGTPGLVPIRIADPPPIFRRSQRVGSDRLSATLQGLPGVTYEIQSSPDLRKWSTVTNLTLGANPASWEAAFQPQPGAAGNLFYRARGARP